MKLPQARLVPGGRPARRRRRGRAAARPAGGAEFGRQHRPGVGRARPAPGARATCPDGCARVADVRAALEVTRTLTAARWPSSALDARILTATLLRRRASTPRPPRICARPPARGPPDRRCCAPAAGTPRASGSDDAGNPRGARAAIRAGLRLLDEHRAVLGAIDVRARAAGHRTALAELGLRIALRSGRPRDVPEWAERGRATGLLMQRSGPAGRPGDRGGARRPARDRPGDQRAARRRPGEEAGPLLARQTALERIRERSLHRGGPADPLAPPAAVDELAAGLGDAGLL